MEEVLTQLVSSITNGKAKQAKRLIEEAVDLQISMEQIHSILQQAREDGYHICGDVWIYQLLTDTSNTDHDTVVLEFALQQSV